MGVPTADICWIENERFQILRNEISRFEESALQAGIEESLVLDAFCEWLYNKSPKVFAEAIRILEETPHESEDSLARSSKLTLIEGFNNLENRAIKNGYKISVIFECFADWLYKKSPSFEFLVKTLEEYAMSLRVTQR